MRAAVIGLGNRDRGDDAVGLLVADELAREPLDADVLAWERPELDLLEVLPRYELVLLVDAARSDAPVGSVHLDPELSRRGNEQGTHGFGIPGVLELAGALDRLPAELHLLLVEIGPVDHGEALSPAVERAVDEIADRLRGVLRGGDADVPR